MDPSREQHLLRWMERLRPDRRYLDILQSEEIGTGWETRLEILRVHYEESGLELEEQVVLRCHQGARAEEKALREAQILHFVAQAGMAVPQVLGYLPNSDELEGSCLIMEHIPGQTVEERFRDKSASEIRASLDHMLTPLVMLHRLPWQTATTGTVLGAESTDQGPADAAERIERLNREIGERRLGDFSPLVTWLSERVPVNLETHLSLCHSDYHPQNLLVTQPEGRVVVLDWSYCSVDDYRLDLAWSVLLFGTMLGAEIRGDVLRSYQRVSGKSVSHFEFFEVLKLTQRLVTLATWLEGQVPSPVQKITPQAMRGAYKVHVLNVYDRLVEVTGIRLQMFEAL